MRVAEIFNNLQYRLIGLSKGVSLVTLINPSSAESAAATCRTIRLLSFLSSAGVFFPPLFFVFFFLREHIYIYLFPFIINT